MFNPKWGVIAAALGVFALAATYSAQLGWAVGVGLVVITAFVLWVQVRFAMQPGVDRADRSALANRFNRLGRNRRVAQKAAQSSAQARSDPAERP